MQLMAQELAIHTLTRYDGSQSAAIKVVHRTSREEAESSESAIQTANLRQAILQLLRKMNPNPDHITIPKLVIFDTVRVRLPESYEDGRIDRVARFQTQRVEILCRVQQQLHQHGMNWPISN